MGFKAITTQAKNRSGFRYKDTDQNSTSKSKMMTIFDEKAYWNVKKAPHTQLAAHEKDRALRVEHSLPTLPPPRVKFMTKQNMMTED